MYKYSIFDERNNLIEECIYGEGYSITKHTGSKVRIYHYKDYKKIDDKNFYYYDSKNKLISEEYWHYRNNKKYELGLKYHYLYDKNNVKIAYINKENDTIVYNLIKKNDTLMDLNGQKFRLENEDTIFYNKLGYPIFIKQYNKGLLNRTIDYYYNDNNKLIKEIQCFNNQYSQPEIIIYKYNKSGKILSNKSNLSLS